MPTADARLAGTRVLVTRPASQAADLLARIRAAGGEPVSFPTLDIEPLAPDRSQLEALAAADTVIFVSANAARYGWPIVRGTAAERRRVVAVGPATARALEQAGCRGAEAPAGDRSSSEELLASSALADAAARVVCVARGHGGRETLRRELESRGARVSYLECYRRRLPPDADPQVLARALDGGAGRLVITVTSVTGLANLLALAPEGRADQLRSRPLVVIGPRQKAAAQEQGWTGPILEAGAGDAHIVEAIADWRERSR